MVPSAGNAGEYCTPARGDVTPSNLTQKDSFLLLQGLVNWLWDDCDQHSQRKRETWHFLLPSVGTISITSHCDTLCLFRPIKYNQTCDLWPRFSNDWVRVTSCFIRNHQNLPHHHSHTLYKMFKIIFLNQNSAPPSWHLLLTKKRHFFVGLGKLHNYQFSCTWAGSCYSLYIGGTIRPFVSLPPTNKIKYFSLDLVLLQNFSSFWTWFCPLKAIYSGGGEGWDELNSSSLLLSSAEKLLGPLEKLNFIRTATTFNFMWNKPVVSKLCRG